jgi:hypothetical protein
MLQETLKDCTSKDEGRPLIVNMVFNCQSQSQFVM